MSRILSIESICERALRKIGAFAIRSSGARPEEIEEARYWLDMVVGQQASRQRTWWLVPSSGVFPLTAGNGGPYDLNALLTTSQAPDGIEFVVQAILYDITTGNDIRELLIQRRQEWETRTLGPLGDPDPYNNTAALGDSNPPIPSNPAAQPALCYIDRAQEPTFQCYPVPDTTRSYGVRLVFQSFASDFTKEKDLDRTYNLRSSMNLWVVTALAAQIGNGPVRKLPADEVRDMRQEATQLRNDLEAYENMEQANEPRRVAFFNF